MRVFIFQFSVLAVALGLIFGSNLSYAKTFYLDGQLTQNCTGNYSISARACAGSDGDAYNTLQGATAALAGGDTLTIRGGTYIRTTNNVTLGSLSISVSGTAAQHTVVQNYPGESPVICTKAGKCQYNPNPGDTSNANCYGAPEVGGSACYYPNPAIAIGGSYIDVVGLKTFGQLLMVGSRDVNIENNDLGGGGPYFNQGQVVSIHGSYNIRIRNNKISHSSWGESPLNGAALMGYRFGDILIENNEFFDNFGPDVKLKDTAGQTGRSTTIRYNFFRPSSFAQNNGVNGIIQYADLDYLYIHNNVFFNKAVGVAWDGQARIGTYVYNNTFVNCVKDVVKWMSGQAINVYNNLHYHTTASQMYYDFSASPLSALNSDFNLFYSTASTIWYNDGNRGSSLGSWQTYSSKDRASVSKNPGFMNPSGNRPEDFKRTDYSGDIAGSTYGAVAGAYETGNEIIGIAPGALPPIDSLAPDAPSGTQVR